MTDYLQAAFDDAENLRSRAAFSKGADTSAGMLTAGTYGFDYGMSKLTKHKEQYHHFKSWTYTAIRAIAQRIAGQDIFVGRIQSTPTRSKLTLPGRLKSLGTRVEPLETHPLLIALADPNPLQVQWSLLYSTAASILLTGRSHWWLTADENGKLQVWPIPAHWLRPSDPMQGSWLLRPDYSSDEYEIANEDVASFMLPDPSTPFGCVSPLQTQAAAVSIDENITRTQFDIFKSGINPQLAIRVGKVPGMTGGDNERPVLTAEQRTELVEAITQLYGGTSKRNAPLILDGMIEGVDRLSSLPAEMDFLQSGEQVKERILLAFGVSDITIGAVSDANRASAAVASQLFAEHTVNPLLELMSQVLTAWVAQRFEPNLVAWIDPARGNDPEQKLNEWKLAVSANYCTPNEYRTQVLNLPPIDGGDVRTDALGNPLEPQKSTLPDFSKNGHARIY
jgi:phage portal protein BeeE